MAGAFYASIVLAVAGCGGSKSPWEPMPLGTKADFRAIWFIDAQHGWIAGGSYEITGGIIGRTSDGGKTWRYVSNLTSRERMGVPALHFFDATRGLAATDSGAIFATMDGGETWTRTSTSGRVGRASNLFFLNDRVGWAAGSGDVIRTEDAGEHWTTAEPDASDTNYRSEIRAIQFLDDRNGWIAGMHASLARTTDGGATWEPVATPIVTKERPSFWDLSFIDTQIGWVVGEEGSMLSTSDGGTTWTRRSTGLKDAQSAAKLERIQTAKGPVEIDAGDRTPGFTITAVRFVDRHRGWVTGFYPNHGRSLILHTEDAGATWRIDADSAGEDLYALFLQGRETLWAIGARTREGQQAAYRRALAAK